MTETQKPLAKRLSSKGTELFLNGNIIFTTPETHFGTRGINVLGVDEKLGIIDIGTGECCYGYFNRLARSHENEKRFGLNFIMPVDFNIYDLLPVIDQDTMTDLPDRQSVIVIGHGCAGGGIRLIGLYPPRIKPVLSAEEHHKVIPVEFERYRPRFIISEGKISLNLIGFGRRFSPERNPRKPSVLHDTSDRTYVVGSNSMDLTDRLIDAGVDIKKTLESTKNYQRIHRR